MYQRGYTDGRTAASGRVCGGRCPLAPTFRSLAEERSYYAGFQAGFDLITELLEN